MVGDADPAHPAHHAGRHPGLPEHKLRVIAPDVGGGFGGKLQVIARGDPRPRVAQKLGKPVKWTETRSESLLSAHHGRDQIQDITIAAKKDGTVTALTFDLLADMGAYFGLFTSGIPIFGAFMSNAIYKFPALPVRPARRVHQQDAHRRLPRRRSSGGHVRHRADHGRAGRRARAATRWSCASRTGSSTRSSRSPRCAGSPTTRATTRPPREKAKALFGYDGAAPRAAGAARAAATRSSWASASRRSPRCAGSPRRRVLGVAGVRRRRLGERVDPDAADRQGRGRHRRLRARAGARDGVEPDRRRPARRAVRGHRGAARRHPGLAEGHGHLRLAVAGRRRHRRGQGGAEGGREGQDDRRAHARGVRGRPRVHRRPVRRSGAPARASRSRRSRSPRSRRTTSPRASSRRSTPTPRSTRRTSRSRTARTSPRSRSTPRPGGSTIRKYVCVDDVGNVVNPLIVEGQMHGGLAQGIAQALFEEANYDEQGTLVNGTFVDYTLPVRGRPAQLHHRPHRDPGHVEPAGCQGRRRGGHDRLHPGDRQRRHRRGAPPRRHPRSRCRRTPQRVWRAIQDAKGRATQETPVDTHSPGAGLGSIDPNNPQGEVQ